MYDIIMNLFLDIACLNLVTEDNIIISTMVTCQKVIVDVTCVRSSKPNVRLF